MFWTSLAKRFSAPANDKSVRNLSATVTGLAYWVIASALAMLLWTYAIASGSEFPIISRALVGLFGQACLIAACAFAVGTLIGFLFGIPRTLQDEKLLAKDGSSQSVNTNLEQISDWLTKILVGVGLTQFQSLQGQLANLATYFAIADTPAVTLGIMLNFGIAGFFSGYLLTRLFLAGAFEEAQRSLQAQATKAAKLQEAGHFGAALNEYESALEQITPTTPKEEKLRIYEGVVFNSLYDPPPAGFEKTIRVATQFLREEPRGASGRLLAYLAAAYGQQYRFEQGRDAPPEKLQEIRANALTTIKQALAVDPDIILLLRMMWDPHAPSKSPGDDDLEVFHEDQEFHALLTRG